MFLKAVWLLACLQIDLVRRCDGLDLSPCRDNVTEVTESGTPSITCSGLDRTQDVVWTVVYTGGNTETLGQCDSVTAPATSSSCTAGSLPGLFTATRPSPTTSVMTINPSALNNGAAYVTGHSLWCSQPPFAFTVCRMDYVYPPDTVSCSVQFLTPSDAAWSASGRCDVTKVYSYLGRYTCQWYQQRGSSPETPLGQTVPIRNSSVTESKYINGSCDVTAAFPVDEGRYSYRVVITPGGLGHRATVTGTSLIRQPSPTHNCSRYVTDGQTLRCTCSDDVGSPPGVAQWSSTQSPQLTVTSAIVGQQQICHVIYNNQAVSPVTYTVEYADEATIRFFAVNSVTSDSLTVNTSDTVTLTCRGVGRPSPEMTLSSITQDTIGHIPQGTPSLQDKVTEVTGSVTAQCHDTGNYTCEASNGVGEKQTRRVTVFVRCKPEVLDNRPGDGGRMEIPSVNFVTKAVRLNFHFAAYPTPQLSDIKFFPQRPNATSVGKPVKGNTIQVACSRHPVDLFNVTCAVTVNDITSSDAGFYQAAIGNRLGDVTVLFQVTVNGGKPDSSLGAGAAVGVSVAVMVVIVVVFFVWLWRRHWVLPCAATEREADVRMESRNVEPAQGIEHHGQGQSDDYEIQDIGGTTSAEYASLKIDDIGLRSVYSKITPTSTSTRTTVTADTGQVYENTDMSSRSPNVNASDYKR